VNVGAAALDEALAEVGRQCRVEILLDSELTAGKTARQNVFDRNNYETFSSFNWNSHGEPCNDIVRLHTRF
jgi:hypothetical protein